MPNTVDDEIIKYPTQLKAVLEDKNAILTFQILDSYVVNQNIEFYEDLLKGKFKCKIEKDERMKIIKYLYEQDVLAKLEGYMNYIKELLKTKEYSSCIYYDKLTVDDLEDLIKNVSVVLTQDQFIAHYITELGSDINKKSDDYKEKIKSYFEKLLKFNSSLPSEEKSITYVILYSILYCNVILDNEYDDKLFKEMMKAGKTYTKHYPFSNEKVKEYNFDIERRLFTSIMMNVGLNNEMNKCDITKLIYTYFYHYYELNKSIDDFSSYVKNEWFCEKKYTLNVYFDRDVGDSLKYLNDKGYGDVVESIKLEIDEFNKTYFHEDETIEVKCYLKNIPELEIKLFEINTLEFEKVFIYNILFIIFNLLIIKIE